jgi:hypothetical protein
MSEVDARDTNMTIRHRPTDATSAAAVMLPSQTHDARVDHQETMIDGLDVTDAVAVDLMYYYYYYYY